VLFTFLVLNVELVILVSALVMINSSSHTDGWLAANTCYYTNTK